MADGTDGLEELVEALPAAHRRAVGISGWSVGTHIHHCCLAMVGICQSLASSAPPPPSTSFNMARRIVFLTGRIPRGRGQSPAEAVPTDSLSPDEMEVLLKKSRRWVKKAGGLSPDTWFDHFAFGILRRDQALRLIRIHNHHHLKIIREILAA